MNNSKTDTPHILTDKWPPRLKDDGQSLMQLIAHEYILRLINTAEGVPGDSAFHLRPLSNYTADEATHAYAGILAACEDPSKQIFTGGLQMEFPARTVDHITTPILQRYINLQDLTLNHSSTCRYDKVIFESFIHSLDLSYPVAPADDLPSVNDRPNTWWCLNGGTDVLAQEMTKNVGKDTITMNARVTAIRKHPFLSHRPMRVLVKGCPTERRYSHVIIITTTPCLQAMDLSGVELQTDQRQAIRVLRYEAAVKLGIKFSKKWWIKLGVKDRSTSSIE